MLQRGILWLYMNSHVDEEKWVIFSWDCSNILGSYNKGIHFNWKTSKTSHSNNKPRSYQPWVWFLMDWLPSTIIFYKIKNIYIWNACHSLPVLNATRFFILLFQCSSANLSSWGSIQFLCTVTTLMNLWVFEAQFKYHIVNKKKEIIHELEKSLWPQLFLCDVCKLQRSRKQLRGTISADMFLSPSVFSWHTVSGAALAIKLPKHEIKMVPATKHTHTHTIIGFVNSNGAEREALIYYICFPLTPGPSMQVGAQISLGCADTTQAQWAEAVGKEM